MQHTGPGVSIIIGGCFSGAARKNRGSSDHPPQRTDPPATLSKTGWGPPKFGGGLNVPLPPQTAWLPKEAATGWARMQYRSRTASPGLAPEGGSQVRQARSFRHHPACMSTECRVPSPRFWRGSLGLGLMQDLGMGSPRAFGPSGKP